MKESYIFERTQSQSMKKQTDSLQKNGTATPVKNQLLEEVLKIMETLIKGEERIQIFKQMLTQRTQFSPQPLYSYISRGQNQIDKRHLMLLFQENQIHIPEEYIKLYLNSYGYKQKIDYSAFINLIFPVDLDLIKYISVTGIKKYSHQSLISQEVLCIFLMLVKQQISLLEELDLLKNDLFPKISRKQIKNLMRIMKKNGQCNSLMEIQSQPFVKYQELKALFKNFVSKSTKNISTVTKKSNKKSIQSTQDNHLSEIYIYLQKNSLGVFRKLSMGKTNFINLQDFQFWLRPWAKIKSTTSNAQQSGPYLSKIFAISGINELDCQSKISQSQNLSIPLSHLCY